METKKIPAHLVARILKYKEAECILKTGGKYDGAGYKTLMILESKKLI